MKLQSTSKYMTLLHPLPLPAQRHRAMTNWLLALPAIATFAYVLIWLTKHSFAQDTHHYVTALVIVVWLASLPALSIYRFVSERRNHHGDF